MQTPNFKSREIPRFQFQDWASRKLNVRPSVARRSEGRNFWWSILEHGVGIGRGLSVDSGGGDYGLASSCHFLATSFFRMSAGQSAEIDFRSPDFRSSNQSLPQKLLLSVRIAIPVSGSMS